jgi:hypothetical protein
MAAHRTWTKCSELGWVDQSDPFLRGRLPGLPARNRDSRPQPQPFFSLAPGNILK